MKITQTELPDVLLIEPRIFRDQRGHFLETFHAARYANLPGLPPLFVQDNLSQSTRGVIRGLHYQIGQPQGKLVMAVSGEIFDVAVDIRNGSPTFGRWIAATLSSENYRQLYIPEGFAHGFCVLSEVAMVLYKCTDYYAPAQERGIRWDDPGLGIPWPMSEPILSPKDREYPSLAQVPIHDLPEDQ